MDADGANVRVLPTSQEGIPAEVEDPEREVVAGSPAWSPDGGAIYYYSQATYYVSSSDGDEQSIDIGPDIRCIDLEGGDRVVARKGYSPAIGPGGRIAFVRPDEGDGPPRYTSGQVVSIGADGSDLRAESAAVPGCFAPDYDEATGRMVCHGSVPAVGALGKFELPFAPPGGIRRVRLPDRTLELRGVCASFPALTPAGELLFTTSGVQRAERTDVRDAPLRVSALDGTGSRALFTPAAGVAWDAAVASEAGWLVLTVGQPFGGADEDVDIWRVRLDGSEATNLTGGVDVNCALPGVSADGRHVVFRRPRGPSEPTYSPESPGMAIYVMDGDGRNPRRLTDSAAYETAPALSPDGEWVVYAAYAAPPAEDALKLWLQRTDGREGRLLEPDRSDIPDLSMHPSFSPDGLWIVFTSDRAGLDDEWPLTFNLQPYGELWAVPVAGGPAVRLTHNKWEDGPSVWGFVRLPDTER
jgi:Tol biopolymer transport system component